MCNTFSSSYFDFQDKDTYNFLTERHNPPIIYPHSFFWPFFCYIDTTNAKVCFKSSVFLWLCSYIAAVKQYFKESAITTRHRRYCCSLASYSSSESVSFVLLFLLFVGSKCSNFKEKSLGKCDDCLKSRQENVMIV